MEKPKVLMVIGDFNGCAMWRGIQPTESLNSRGFPCAWRNRTAKDIDAQTNAADIVILERIYWMPGHMVDMEEWFYKIHRIGDKRRLVVYEVDDDVVSVDSLAHTKLFHHDWSDDDAEAHRQATIEAMKRCDAITTTNESLANLMRKEIGIPVYVLPNAIRWGAWRASWKSKPRTIDNKIVIGWAGGLRIKDDLAPMIDAWKVIAQYYDNVHFVIAGQVHDEYQNALPSDRVTLRPWVEANKYPHQYADFDIACCPLADLPFNHMKTPCKAFEAGAAEAAVVASPVIYGDVIDHGKNGFIAHTVEEWVNALTYLIENEKSRKSIARRWSMRVEQRHNLDRNCWQWAAAWTDIMRNGPRYDKYVDTSDSARVLITV